MISQQAAYKGANREEFEQRLDHLRIYIAFLTDRLQETRDSADRWLASPEPKATFDIGWIRVIRSVCLLTSYQFFAAREAMRLAEPYVQEVGSPYVTAWCSLVRGTTELYEGNSAEAYRIIISSRVKAGRALGEDSNICDTMASIAAKCAVEMGLVDEARELLGHMLPSARWHGTVGSTACGIDAAIALWNGQPNDIVDLDELRDIAASYPPRLELMMTCHLIRRLIVLGQVRNALAEATRLRLDLNAGTLRGQEDQIPRVRELIAATAIDLLIAMKNDAKAEILIEAELQSARNDGRVGRQIELELACLELDWRNDRLDCARRRLVRALRQAAPRRVVRPFAERIAVVAAIMQVKTILPALLATQDERNFLESILDLIPRDPSQSQPTASSEESFDMPTRRELELLAMVEVGLSNQELAEQTDTSITTIKWHLRNLFRKLNVSNRTSAVARAHAIGLLSR
jgi:LuxR family maltose regulon positive regulatory protein